MTYYCQAWNNAVTQAWKRTQADDPVHALARAMREGRGDAVMVKPQWNMPVPGESAACRQDNSRVDWSRFGRLWSDALGVLPLQYDFSLARSVAVGPNSSLYRLAC